MADTWADTIADLKVTYQTTVTAQDVADFARLSGDDYEAHTDPDFMAASSFGRQIAHGALLVGYMSATGTIAIRAAKAKGNTTIPVSLGYDRLRFVAPVFFGDTLTTTYHITSIDHPRHRSLATIEIVNQDAKIVAIGEHVMKWLQSDAD